jgi:hypothetical protein
VNSGTLRALRCSIEKQAYLRNIIYEFYVTGHCMGQIVRDEIRYLWISCNTASVYAFGSYPA